MKWVIRENFSNGFYTIIGLQHFLSPIHFDGNAQFLQSNGIANGFGFVTCEDFSRSINDELNHLRAVRTTPNLVSQIIDENLGFQCNDLTGLFGNSRPYWEWNVIYLVRQLRDEQGLFGWWLFDEPENPQNFWLFGRRHDMSGGVISNHSNNNPGSCPTLNIRPWARLEANANNATPNLLHFFSNLVNDAEQREVNNNRQYRHPSIIDFAEPHLAFSNRYFWSTASNDALTNPERSFNPGNYSGPFDVVGSTCKVPADILSIDASEAYWHMRNNIQGVTPMISTYQKDPNLPLKYLDFINHVNQHDPYVWATMYIAQSQVTDAEGYRALYNNNQNLMPGNDCQQCRMLNERDIIFQLITPLLDGAVGMFHYGYARLPAQNGALDQNGSQLYERIGRAVQNFRQQLLDVVLQQAPKLINNGWQINGFRVESLTDYAIVEADIRGGRSVYNDICHFNNICGNNGWNLNSYTGQFFRRQDPWSVNPIDPNFISHARATINDIPLQAPNASYNLLRGVMHYFNGSNYLFLSNAYDSHVSLNIRVNTRYSSSQVSVANSAFSNNSFFNWDFNINSTSGVTNFNKPFIGNYVTFDVSLGPYEVKIIRLGTSNSLKRLNLSEKKSDVRINEVYPNPSNGSTTIRFSISTPSLVIINIYDVSGRVVKRVMNNQMEGGVHTVDLNTFDLASGVYLYKIQTEGSSIFNRLTIVK